MKALAVLVVLVLLVGTMTPSNAWAHGCCFWWPAALFGGLLFGAAVSAAAHPYYYAPPVVYQTAPVYASAPPPAAPAVQREVVYSNGRYVLFGDGVSQPWQWVWIPAAPAPPAPPR
jgi:hypothetical protein